MISTQKDLFGPPKKIHLLETAICSLQGPIIDCKIRGESIAFGLCQVEISDVGSQTWAMEVLRARIEIHVLNLDYPKSASSACLLCQVPLPEIPMSKGRSKQKSQSGKASKRQIQSRRGIEESLEGILWRLLDTFNKVTEIPALLRSAKPFALKSRFHKTCINELLNVWAYNLFLTSFTFA